jgi:HTH-type transcriptional regulator/antitoxin HipB
VKIRRMFLDKNFWGFAVEQQWVVRTGADFGRAIAEVRTARGLTQADLAEPTGLSRSWLARLETGRSATVLDHMLRVLRHLGARVTISFDVDEDE